MDEFEELELYEWVLERSKSIKDAQLRTRLVRGIAGEGLSTGQRQGLAKNVGKDSIKDYLKDNPKEPDELTKAVLTTAYTHILDTNCEVDEAFAYAAKVHAKQLELLLEERSKKRYGWSREIEKTKEHHPVVKGMKKEGSAYYRKRDLARTTTAFQLLSTLKGFREAYAGLLELREQVDTLNSRVVTLETEVILHGEILNRLENAPNISSKDKAILLRKSGKSIGYIAQYLDVTKRTVQRWINVTP